MTAPAPPQPPQSLAPAPSVTAAPHSTLRKVLLACGILSSLLYVGVGIVAGQGISVATNVLIAAVAIELAFVAYCVVTKSNQTRARSSVRIGASGGFVLLTLLSVIEWSFRWYRLAALLLAWSVLGVWALIARTVEKKGYSPGYVVIRAIATMTLVTIAVSPALVFPQFGCPR